MEAYSTGFRPEHSHDADMTDNSGASSASTPCADAFAGLPPVDTKRWVARRKAEVLAAIVDGRIGRAEACRRYTISEAELRLWERAVDCAGIPGLRVTRVQIYRPIFEAHNPR
jgi:hypothetical protein